MAVLAALGLGGLTLAACGSSSPSATSASTRNQDCTAVSNVLSDGPDSSADPVGYAQAQVLPLEQLKLADPAVRTSVSHLDSAYKALVSSNGAAGDGPRVSAAESALNRLCPDAAP